MTKDTNTQDYKDKLPLNEIWEILHADGYTVVEVETMYAEWIYHYQK